MARYGYIVVEPSNVEGFRKYVLRQMRNNEPIQLQAVVTDELSRRRAGQDAPPKTFVFADVVRINNVPSFMPTLYSEEHDQDVTFSVVDKHVEFGIYLD